MVVVTTPGRGGGHEDLLERPFPLRRVEAAAEPGALGLDPGEVLVAHLGDGGRRVVDPRPRRPAGLQQLRPLGVEPGFERHRALPLAPEPRHPRGHVGLEAHPGLLAVVADVHPARELAVHDVLHGGLDLAREPRLVDRLLVVLAHQEVGEDLAAGEASHVGGEDAGFARLHGAGGSRGRGLAASVSLRGTGAARRKRTGAPA